MIVADFRFSYVLLFKGEYSFVIFDVASLREFLKPDRGKSDVFMPENYPRIVFGHKNVGFPPIGFQKFT